MLYFFHNLIWLRDYSSCPQLHNVEKASVIFCLSLHYHFADCIFYFICLDFEEFRVHSDSVFNRTVKTVLPKIVFKVQSMKTSTKFELACVHSECFIFTICLIDWIVAIRNYTISIGDCGKSAEQVCGHLYQTVLIYYTLSAG